MPGFILVLVKGVRIASMETPQEWITPEWLTNRLRKNRHLPQGEVIAVDFKASYKHHFELAVTYSEEVPGSLPEAFILKWYRGGHGIREGFFFQHIVPAMEAPPVPKCYDVGIDGDGEQTYLLLEDLSATHYTALYPYSDLERETFEQVTSAFATIHAHWWDHLQISQDAFLRGAVLGVAHEAVSLRAIRENERYFSEQVLPARMDQYKGSIPEAWPALFENVIAAWGDLFTGRTAGGAALTLVQGDAQLGNMLLPRQPGQNHPVIIDWEGCTRGLGVWDLARTLIQTGYPSDKRLALEKALLPFYHSRLVEHGIKDYSLDHCVADYRLCVLANIPHALAWEDLSYLESALRAFKDWGGDEFLD